MIIIGYSELP